MSALTIHVAGDERSVDQGTTAADLFGDDRALVIVRPGQGQSYALSVAAIRDQAFADKRVAKCSRLKMVSGTPAARRPCARLI